MQDGKAASGGAPVPAMHLAWNRGAKPTHPHLGEVVLIGATLALVGLLMATFQNAFEAPPFLGDLGLGAAPH